VGFGNYYTIHTNLPKERKRCELQTALEDISYLYTCGTQCLELEFTGRLKDVYTRDIPCEDSMYYSAKYAPICV